jgi:hypothetical protein
MNNFNSKDVLINDVSLCGDLPTVQTAINELIQQVNDGGYQILSGDLVGYNPNNNQVDIINISLKSPNQAPLQSFLNVDRMMFHNQTETNLAHDDLCETMGLAVVEQRGNDNALEGYLVLRGYESFTQEIMLLVPEEQPDEQKK